MIKIIAFGKIKSNKNFDELFHIYHKMVGWKLEVIELEIKKKLSPQELKLAEAELILSYFKIAEVNILLDETGREYSSINFASFLSKIIDSAKSINFVIGGAYGVTEEVKNKASFTLSLSKMTLPHLFARVLLIEQIYRAQTIINNHPYHK